jgi:hypothetical protein
MSVVLTKSAPVTVYADEKGNFNRKYNKLRLQQLLVGSNYNNTGFSTAANPEITFNADPKSGLYLKANNVIGIGINNLEVGTIDSAGIHGAVGGGTTDSTLTVTWIANPAAPGTSTVQFSKIGSIVLATFNAYTPSYNGTPAIFLASTQVPVGLRPSQLYAGFIYVTYGGNFKSTPGVLTVDVDGFIQIFANGDDSTTQWFTAGPLVGWLTTTAVWTTAP